ncbi:MAG: helicase C-terminal domain-containing protein, partial [Chloroflexota bacterium]
RLPSAPYLHAVDDENGKARSRWQPGMTGKLRRLGLIKNKHIPAIYLRASERQRRDLLAGLVDTDGTVSHGGAVEFTTTNCRLAQDVTELINTLGYRAAVREGRARLNGRDCGPKWTVGFTTDQAVFRLRRKQIAQAVRLRSYSPARNRFRYVVAVRPVPTRPVRCIQVDGASHLYLAGRSFIPTHNSLAYLLPAVEYAVANGRRVVVSTNTINLQEQLYFKDIPLLRRALPTQFQAAVLKGRTNYLCLRRWRSFLRESVNNDADRLLAAKILLWLRETETGDRNELVLDDREAARWASSLAADALHCTPKMCRDNRVGRCFLSRARRRAEAAHILVVNHALLLADQALESKVLPEYADLVVDEAHHLEDAATRQLGVQIDQQELAFFLAALSQQQGPGRYAGLVSRAQTVLIASGGAPMRSQAGELTQPAHDAAESARRALHEFFDAVTAFLRGTEERSGYREREVRLTAALRATDGWSGVEAAWEPLGEALGSVDTAIAGIADALEPFEGSAEIADDTLADLAAAQRQLGEVRIHLSAIVDQPQADEVYWVSARDRGIALQAAPLEVGTLLQRQLFSQKDCVVLASATVQVGGSFRYLRERLGLDPTTFTLAVPSPFDYPEQALLCVPYDLPDPSARTFQEAAHHALAAICQATGGRTLVLFTSHAALRAAHEQLRRRLRRLVVLGQGLDGSRQHLLERFRQTPNAVLLGTNSFWEGVDVVGDALSCLVIVKLPFSVPNDPVFAARSELFEDPFSEYAVPQAVLRLKQGFGRLIRSGSDRGVVAVLDSRLWTKRYGGVFLRSLPPATQRRCSWREVADLARDWLDRDRVPLTP